MTLLAVVKASASVAVSSFDGCAGTYDAASGTVSGSLCCRIAQAMLHFHILLSFNSPFELYSCIQYLAIKYTSTPNGNQKTFSLGQIYIFHFSFSSSTFMQICVPWPTTFRCQNRALRSNCNIYISVPTMPVKGILNNFKCRCSESF